MKVLYVCDNCKKHFEEPKVTKLVGSKGKAYLCKPCLMAILYEGKEKRKGK